MHKTIMLATCLALAACGGYGSTTTISSNPNPAPAIFGALPASKFTANDLRTVAQNFDAANSVGVPDTLDLSACQHWVNMQLGVEIDPAAAQWKTAVLSNQGVLSGLSEIVIEGLEAQQFAAGGIVVPQNCATVLGLFNVRQMAAAVKALPGGGVIPVKLGPALTPAQMAAIVAANAPPPVPPVAPASSPSTPVAAPAPAPTTP